MGDRVSISFVNRGGILPYGKEIERESVALFHHWGGMEFVKIAEEYVKQLVEKLKKNPLSIDSDKCTKCGRCLKI